MIDAILYILFFAAILGLTMLVWRIWEGKK